MPLMQKCPTCLVPVALDDLDGHLEHHRTIERALGLPVSPTPDLPPGVMPRPTPPDLPAPVVTMPTTPMPDDRAQVPSTRRQGA